MARPGLRLPERLRPYVIAPLLVLLATIPFLRALGALGLPRVASWRDATRHALAVMFVFTGWAHFGRQRDDLVRMVPSRLPAPHALVTITGLLEFLGSLGLVVPRMAPLAGGSLIALLTALFPANIQAARRGIAIAGKPATPLWFRTLVQTFYVALTWWSTRS